MIQKPPFSPISGLQESPEQVRRDPICWDVGRAPSVTVWWTLEDGKVKIIDDPSTKPSSEPNTNSSKRGK